MSPILKTGFTFGEAIVKQIATFAGKILKKLLCGEERDEKGVFSFLRPLNLKEEYLADWLISKKVKRLALIRKILSKFANSPTFP